MLCPQADMNETYSAGKVRRWHTHPNLAQTQADHSWGVAMILLKYHPNPSRDLILEALMHDAHEVVTGDVPGPHKTPAYREWESRMRREFRQRNGLPICRLSSDDMAWLKLADALEAKLFLQVMASSDAMATEAAARLELMVEERRAALEQDKGPSLFDYADTQAETQSDLVAA